MKKLAVRVGILCAAIIAMLYSANCDINAVVATLAHVKLSVIALIMLCYLLIFYLVALRNYLFYKQFNIPISFANAKMALLSGQLGGILPIFGPVFGQSIILKKATNLSSITSAFMFFYDKIIMALTGACLGFFSLIVLMKDKGILQKILAGTKTFTAIEHIVVLVACLMVPFFFAVPPAVRTLVYKHVNKRSCFFVAAGVIISVIVWMMSAASFLTAITFLNSAQAALSAWQIFCGGIIVCFLASMPISVNGWGVREYSAVTVFSFLNVPTETALSASVMIGVLSLVVLACIAPTLSRVEFRGQLEIPAK